VLPNILRCLKPNYAKLAHSDERKSTSTCRNSLNKCFSFPSWPSHFFDISVYIYTKSCVRTIAIDPDKLNFRWRLPLARPLVIRANYQTEMTGADRFEGHPKRCGRCVVREIWTATEREREKRKKRRVASVTTTNIYRTASTASTYYIPVQHFFWQASMRRVYRKKKGEKMVHRTASITITTETPAHSNTHLAHTHNGTSSELELIGTCRLSCLAAKSPTREIESRKGFNLGG
jgi:hypothetical protein